MKRFLFIYIICLAVTSCERQEDVDIDVKYKKKMVAGVFIGAGDSIIGTSLTSTTPVFGAPPAMDARYVTTAKGTLIINGAQLPLTYDSMGKVYTALTLPHVASSGDIYEIQFENEGESINGRTHIPAAATVDVQLKLDSSGDASLPQYNATFRCTLVSEAPAYVRILPLLIMEDSFTVIPMYTGSSTTIKLLHKGESVGFNFYASAAIDGLHAASVKCIIITCDEAYAKYYNATQGADFSAVVPGAEPSQTYSNMSNNVGIICSYNICGEAVFEIR